MIERSLWNKPFAKDKFPKWMCSRCYSGFYQVLTEFFHYFKDANTLAEENEDYFDDDYIVYRFSSVLKCNNPACQETSILTGRGGVQILEQEGEESNSIDYIKYFYPEYCYPPPAVFALPPLTPEPIKENILGSFSIFFSDYHSAANKLRSSLEHLLNYENTPKNNSLQIRINALCEQYSLNTNNFFDAIRIIGNEGSHGGSKSQITLTLDTIFDAFELMSFLLKELYFDKVQRAHLDNISKKYCKKS